ncbi:MAG TPA: hypothetical protein VIB39_20350 [Candidatus Angelobacter sp.]|jgi:hypothetical protein
MLQKGKIFVSAIVVVLFLAGAVPLRAAGHDEHRKCEQRIHNAEARLQNAIRKHGERSRQAEKRRRELEDVRAHCRY